jgi:2-aminoadipate transaminase
MAAPSSTPRAMARVARPSSSIPGWYTWDSPRRMAIPRRVAGRNRPPYHAKTVTERFAASYARRTEGMKASEVRALFAVASRPDVISLAGGMPFVQALPADEVLAVVAEVVGRRGGVALQYGGGGGQEGLKERLVDLMAEEGVEGDPARMVITVGAQQALDLVGKVLIDPGDLVAVEAPSYVGALSAFAAYQPRWLQIPMDDDGLMVEDLEEALAGGERPKFLYTCPNFHNPAGVTLSLERRRRLVEVCRAAGVPIVEDNPYGMLRFEGEGLPSLRSLDPDNVLYLGTLSKVFCPGIRVGWALGDPDMVQRMILFKEASDLCSSNLNQLVAEEWLSEPDRWRSSLAGLTDVYRRRRDACLAALERHFPPGATWTHPGGGFYVWVKLPSHLDATALLPTAVERRVAYVPGTAFFPDGTGRDRLRLAFCYPPEDDIEEGVRRLGELLTDVDAGQARPAGPADAPPPAARP